MVLLLPLLLLPIAVVVVGSNAVIVVVVAFDLKDFFLFFIVGCISTTNSQICRGICSWFFLFVICVEFSYLLYGHLFIGLIISQVEST